MPREKDEDSLLGCIYRNIRVSLAEEELDVRATELLKVNKRAAFRTSNAERADSPYLCYTQNACRYGCG